MKFTGNKNSFIPDYRADIDGLRALAVLSVIFFHANFPFFSGGFIGVDIFFVISGFLISKIIITKLEVGEFSLLDFYEKRARRLFAPIIVVSFATYCLCFILLMPSDFKSFLGSLVATFTFTSNLYFLSIAGYFDTAAHFKPLLHTWSLSVEEQFYVFFPFLLFCAQKTKFWWSILFSTFICSYILCIFFTEFHQEQAFYIVIFRVWEFLIGTAAYFFLQNKAFKATQFSNLICETISIISISSIALSILFINKNYFPGWVAIIPVLSTGLIIICNGVKITLIGRILSHPTVTYIGKLSFSLYLWHWPLFSLYRYYFEREIYANEAIILIIISFILSIISYHLIELPFRYRKTRFFKHETIAISLIISVFAISVGFHGRANQGYPERFSENAQIYLKTQNDWSKLQFKCADKTAEQISKNDICQFGRTENNQLNILLWGDSHATAMLPALKAIATKEKMRVTFIGTNGCPPILNVNVKQRPCKQANDATMRRIEEGKFNLVFMAANWISYGNKNQLYRHGEKLGTRGLVTSFSETISRLKSLGIKIIFIDQVPSYNVNVPTFLAKSHALSSIDKITGYLRKLPKPSTTSLWLNQSLKSNLELINYRLKPKDLLCQNDRCNVIQDGITLYKDASHISNKGAYLFIPAIKKAIRTVLILEQSEGGR